MPPYAKAYPKRQKVDVYGNVEDEVKRLFGGGDQQGVADNQSESFLQPSQPLPQFLFSGGTASTIPAPTRPVTQDRTSVGLPPRFIPPPPAPPQQDPVAQSLVPLRESQTALRRALNPSEPTPANYNVMQRLGDLASGAIGTVALPFTMPSAALGAVAQNNPDNPFLGAANVASDLMGVPAQAGGQLYEDAGTLAGLSESPAFQAWKPVASALPYLAGGMAMKGLKGSIKADEPIPMAQHVAESFGAPAEISPSPMVAPTEPVIPAENASVTPPTEAPKTVDQHTDELRDQMLEVAAQKAHAKVSENTGGDKGTATLDQGASSVTPRQEEAPVSMPNSTNYIPNSTNPTTNLVDSNTNGTDATSQPSNPPPSQVTGLTPKAEEGVQGQQPNATNQRIEPQSNQPEHTGNDVGGTSPTSGNSRFTPPSGEAQVETPQTATSESLKVRRPSPERIEEIRQKSQWTFKKDKPTTTEEHAAESFPKPEEPNDYTAGEDISPKAFVSTPNGERGTVTKVTFNKRTGKSTAQIMTEKNELQSHDPNTLTRVDKKLVGEQGALIDQAKSEGASKKERASKVERLGNLREEIDKLQNDPQEDITKESRIADLRKEYNDLKAEVSIGASNIQRLADKLTSEAEEPTTKQPTLPMKRKKEGGVDLKSSLGFGMEDVLSSVGKHIAARTKNIGKLPESGDYQNALGNFQARASSAIHTTNQMIEDVRKAVPTSDRQNAMTMWLQAEGEARHGSESAGNASPKTADDYLREWSDTARNPSVKKASKDALTLTGEERGIAQALGDVLNVKGKIALNEGIIKTHRGWGYLPGEHWKVIANKTISRGGAIKKEKFYNNYFESTEEGLIPKNLKIGILVGRWLERYGYSDAFRKWREDMLSGTASDGRPLMAPEGSRGTADYQDTRLPMLNARDVVVDGKTTHIPKYVVHPDYARHVHNAFGWNETQYSKAKIVQNINREVKAAKFGLIAPMHEATVREHAAVHNVWKPEEINLDKPTEEDLNPDKVSQYYMVAHDLVLHDASTASLQMEGVGGAGIATKTADWIQRKAAEKITGKNPELFKNAAFREGINVSYQKRLFGKIIPGLKVSVWRKKFAANLKTYSDDIRSGKASVDQVARLTSSQVNADFGGLNYQALGRNPTTQSYIRLLLLAPDFLESRARMVGQSARGAIGAKNGRAQAIVLGRLFVANYVAARIGNAIVNGDPEWDLQHALSVVNKKTGHSYGLRTVPFDMSEIFIPILQAMRNSDDDKTVDQAMADAIGWLDSRVSPIASSAKEHIERRNYFGQHVPFSRTIIDDVGRAVPMLLSSIPHFPGHQDWKTVWENFAQSMGLVTRVPREAKGQPSTTPSLPSTPSLPDLPILPSPTNR